MTTAGKIAAVVFGVLGLLAGAALVAGAVTILTEDRDDGFYTTEDHTFERGSHAIISEDLDILSDAPGWVVDAVADPVDLRITGSTGARGIFLGIAPTSEVDRYLAEVHHDEVTDIHLDGRSITDVDYEDHDGPALPPPPGSEDFWETSIEGVGPQTLDWDLDSGNWTIVVMNADGLSGIEADLAFGARISNIIAIGWAVLAFGILSLLGGGSLLYRGVRRPTDLEPAQREFEPPNDEVDLRDQPASEDQLTIEDPVVDQQPARQD